jgi:hypothetical protein
VVRLASPRRWWGKTDADEDDHRANAPADADTHEQGRRDRKQRYEHSEKIEEATEKAAVAIRDAAAQAAADRAHARARTSALASAALVVAVVAALIVATGALVVIGVIVGVVALALAIGGLSATGRRYSFLAGRTQAVIGLLLATTAITVGILAIAGVLSELGPDTNQVERLGDLLPGWLR